MVVIDHKENCPPFGFVPFSIFEKIFILDYSFDSILHSVSLNEVYHSIGDAL